jgi:hypothetical protein
MRFIYVMYRQLNAERTIETISILKNRINERFPDSGLSNVASELERVANETVDKLNLLSKANKILRGTLISTITLGVILLLGSIFLFDFESIENLNDFLPLIETIINTIVLIFAGIFFLFSIEARIKRSKILIALHELRSIAHVIDMHQLTKDPSLFLMDYQSTTSSPKRVMTAFQLTRYLDFCSELLSLTGKVASLYAERFPDEVVLSTVNNVESLSSGLSRKIWQKIMILNHLDDSKEKIKQIVS